MLPIDRVLDRVKIAQSNNDSEYFDSLLLLLAAILKVTTAGMVAAIEDDPERHRHRLECKLVRAAGIGEWVDALRDTCTGPASFWLNQAAKDEERKQLTDRTEVQWKSGAAQSLIDACRELEIPVNDRNPKRIDILSLFEIGILIRNKTQGHGAKLLGQKSKAAPLIHSALTALRANLPTLSRSWAYLHKNFSGRYKIATINGIEAPFTYLKNTSDKNFTNGVYVHLDKHLRVTLLSTNSDLTDFFFPNGGFTDNKFETVSYSTGQIEIASSAPFLGPIGQLPPSATEGTETLDVIGETFSNAPLPARDYVARGNLETQLHDTLLNQNFPLITLAGRGGIGKTSLALAVIQRLCNEANFEFILWFSARDIDLLPQGPKTVTPKFQKIEDVADQFADLLQIPTVDGKKKINTREIMQQWMGTSDTQRILFVFDNFETVENPKEFFEWLSTYIRLPNKILITTRTRQFTGDFKIDVLGMSLEEANLLITAAARSLGIEKLLTPEYQELLFTESEGHPYVIKILLGEVARAGKLAKVDRIMGGSEAILNALFDRTYATLCPAAQRVYLTLCSWNSTVSQLALEAVLLRPANEERIDVDRALDELEQFSMIERQESASDSTMFIRVPLASMLFGQKRVDVSPHAAKIRADAELLQLFGAAKGTATRHGFSARLQAFVKAVSKAIHSHPDTLDKFVPILTAIGAKFPEALYDLALLYTERDSDGDRAKKEHCLEKYLESSPTAPRAYDAWKLLSYIRRFNGDTSGELQALISSAVCADAPIVDISAVANKINSYLSHPIKPVEESEKTHLIKPLADVMFTRLKELDADDCSRLGWLLLHLNDFTRARKTVLVGLERRPHNEHLLNLRNRLTGIVDWDN